MEVLWGLPANNHCKTRGLAPTETGMDFHGALLLQIWTHGLLILPLLGMAFCLPGPLRLLVLSLFIFGGDSRFCKYLLYPLWKHLWFMGLFNTVKTCLLFFPSQNLKRYLEGFNNFMKKVFGQTGI